MCLDQVKRVYDGKSEEIVHRWKVFNCLFNSSRLQFLFYGMDQYMTDEWDIKRGIWLRARSVIETTFDDHKENPKSYMTGFHCYQMKSAYHPVPENEKVVEVKVRGLLAEGIEYDRRVEVYKEMMVPES